MIILAIETSCDDTCVSVLEIKNWKLKILSNIVSSQVKLHQKYGGVWPYLAKREHQRNLAPVLKKALEEARLLKSKIKNRVSIYGNEGEEENEDLFAHQKSKLQFKIQNLNKTLSRKIDFVTVTVGPGLEPCLWVGINFVKDLAKKLNLKKIVPVNHIEAHIFANWLSPIRSKSKIKNQKSKIIFPAVCLVVSGGHTQLILMKNFGNYKILGETRDDAAGECFDKAARILGLPYPGGPAIAAQAKILNLKSLIFNLRLPRPMIHQKNYDFSFAGLKTAVLYKVKGERLKVKDKQYVREMCQEVQQSIIDVLIAKTIRAAKAYQAKSIILGGGVAANEELRKQFKEAIKKQLPNTLYLIPETLFCTDNAAMVAITAYFHRLQKEEYDLEKIKANANLKIDYNPPKDGSSRYAGSSRVPTAL